MVQEGTGELQISEDTTEYLIDTTTNSPSWEVSAIKDEHIWIPTRVSGDFCYVGELYCSKNGTRLKCSSCNIVIHESCTDTLMRKVRFKCRPTFADICSIQSQKHILVEHHWVRGQTEKKRCQHCMKVLQNKIRLNSKDIVPISCSWCKAAYHCRESCFDINKVVEQCDLGALRSLIVPPNWIFKINPVSRDDSSAKPVGYRAEHQYMKDIEHTSFLVRPISNADMSPLIIFINPKSGGNQGHKILQEFQSLLNPRQVFDLSQGGPKFGLMLYRRVQDLRILACGGDGTVGWILSVIDQLGIVPPPAVGVLPLGTGNDLARTLGWGGGYSNEPAREILSNIRQSKHILLDRWKIDIEKNTNVKLDENGSDSLPQSVMNNYFSMGVDANIALEFHEAREAQPDKFNSRLKNKMFYGQLGGKDLLLRKWKSLSDFIEMECDGTDFTQKLRELRVHAVLFLNIKSYGGGTKPWDKAAGTLEPTIEDGYLEVIGLTTYQLPLLQAGGHGTCITQCKSAKIVTSRTIPMQVDGEACKVTPAVITISLMNKATMLASKGKEMQKESERIYSNLEITVYYLTEKLLEESNCDINFLTESANLLNKFELDYTSNLEILRSEINTFLSEMKDERSSSDWFFIDSFSSRKFLRIDLKHEKLLYVSDVADEKIFIVECDTGARCLSPKNEVSIATSKTPEADLDLDNPLQSNVSVKSKKIEDRCCTHQNNAPLRSYYTRLQLSYNKKSVAERLLSLSDDSQIYPRYPLYHRQRYRSHQYAG